ncbi:MAG: formylmethanofuran dehydrogenase subunit B, partial [Dehalococcoidia bacterium]
MFYAGDDLERRAPFSVGGSEVHLEKALEKAAHLLREAQRPLIFGLDSCTLEAQAMGIALAQALGAVTDDTSSFCQGAVVQGILDGNIPTCSFPVVKNTDLLFYWGCNPYHSHPRHIAKFSYYAYDRWDEAGWVPRVVNSCVEVRDTQTTALCHPVFKVEPGGDGDFIGKILAAARGGEETEETKAFLALISNSAFCVIYVGLGLIYALDHDLSLFTEMLTELSRWTRFAVIPMIGHFNTLGFNHSLHEKTGYINKVSFADGISHGDQFSFLEQIRNRVPDCVLIVGSDPFSSQPRSLMRNLEGVPIICLDPFVTSTTMAAEVVFGTA